MGTGTGVTGRGVSGNAKGFEGQSTRGGLGQVKRKLETGVCQPGRGASEIICRAADALRSGVIVFMGSSLSSPCHIADAAAPVAVRFQLGPLSRSEAVIRPGRSRAEPPGALSFVQHIVWWSGPACRVDREVVKRSVCWQAPQGSLRLFIFGIARTKMPHQKGGPVAS